MIANVESTVKRHESSRAGSDQPASHRRGVPILISGHMTFAPYGCS